MPHYGLGDRQKAVMRTIYGALMADRCTLSVRSNTTAASGQPVASWSSYATNVPCGFEFSPFKFRSREIVGAGEETAEILVRCRLPVTYYDAIDTNDRIILTARFGETYTTPETYEIQGFLERGPTGLIVNLKRIQP